MFEYTPGLGQPLSEVEVDATAAAALVLVGGDPLALAGLDDHEPRPGEGQLNGLAAAPADQSAGLKTSVHRTMKLGALVGRGSGEAVQLAFAGSGFVVVQASEGQGVAPHSHGGGGRGGVDLDVG